MLSFPKVEQPNMKVKLFPHQLSAIYLMEQREKNRTIKVSDLDDYEEIVTTKMSIFSDIVGYGKTFSVIGLIVRDKMEWDINTQYKLCVTSTNDIGNRGIINEKRVHIKTFTKINTTLIVVNNSLINQWLGELSKSDLKIKVIKKTIEALKDDITQFDVVLVSSKMYNALAKEWGNVAWKRFIFDEPQSTRIPSMKTICAGYYWLISATPLSLYNRYNSTSNHFIYSIFNSRLVYDSFNAMIVKNDDNYVKQSYKLPEVKDIFHECYQPIYNMVNGYVDNITLSLISAGDISGAIERLGGDETSNIVELIKKKKGDRIDLLKLLIRQSPENRNISKWNEEIIKLEKDILELKDKFEEKLKSDCTICLDTLEKPILVPCCQNIFCGTCFLKWRQEHGTCPLCRERVIDKQLIHINSDNTKKEEKKCIVRKPTKPEMILNIVKNNKEGKFIIFSQFDVSFEKVTKLLRDTNITFAELKGHSTTISKTIKNFKEGKIQMLYLNSNYNGAGINLQEATDIIFYHTYTNDNITKQIIGRANRIGRKGDLYVHHLI